MRCTSPTSNVVGNASTDEAIGLELTSTGTEDVGTSMELLARTTRVAVRSHDQQLVMAPTVTGGLR